MAGNETKANQPMEEGSAPAPNPHAMSPGLIRRSRNVLYTASAFIFVVVSIVTFIPMIDPSFKSFYQQPSILNIIYMILSLAVAMITFGVIADSTATFEIPVWFKGALTLSGSVAGCAAFFYMLNYNLAPYESKLFVLHSGNENTALSNNLSAQIITDEFTLLVPVSDRNIRVNLPRKINKYEMRISSHDSLSWSIASTNPIECFDGEMLVNACEKRVDVYLQGGPCLDTVEISMTLDNKTTLGEALISIREKALRLPRMRAEIASFGNGEMDALRMEKVDLTDYPKDTLDFCSHLRFIENRFNDHFGRDKLKIIATCEKILFGPRSDYVNVQMSDVRCN